MNRHIISVILAVCFFGNTLPGRGAFAQTTAVESSPTLKEKFIIRNAFFNKYGIAWAAATEEQRQAFLKEWKNDQKAVAKKKRQVLKRVQAADKKKRQLKKAEDQKRKARLKAERDRKKKEDAIKRTQDKKRAALKRKMKRL